jgi:hypothetical protein
MESLVFLFIYPNQGDRTMSIELMRKAIEKVYPNETWKKKVSKMTNGQILAIYNRMLENKQLVS